MRKITMGSYSGGGWVRIERNLLNQCLYKDWLPICIAVELELEVGNRCTERAPTRSFVINKIRKTGYELEII